MVRSGIVFLEMVVCIYIMMIGILRRVNGTRGQVNRVPEYHVGCGLTGIYAGTLNPFYNNEWQSKSKVTDEAIKAVATWMFIHIPEGETSYACAMKTYNGKYIRLKVEVSDKCPEWAKDVLEGEQE